MTVIRMTTFTVAIINKRTATTFSYGGVLTVIGIIIISP